MAGDTTSEGSRLPFNVDDLIEVYWTIIRDEGTDAEKEVSLWWPARVEHRATTAGNEPVLDENNLPVFSLHYQAHDEFEEEHALVALESDHVLHDQGTGDTMAWRKMGDPWDDVDAALARDEEWTAEDIAANELATMQEETGLSSLEEAIDHLQGALPRDQMLDGARKVSTFVDVFKEQMRNTLEAQGRTDDGPIVVTKDMVDQVMARVHATQQGRA